MRSWALRGGRVEPSETIPLSDRGFRYGMGVFETLRVRDGRAEFLREHLAAFERACSNAGLSAGINAFPREEQVAALARTLPDGLLRLVATAGDGTPSDPIVAGRVCLFFDPRPPLSVGRHLEGYRVAQPIPCYRTHLPSLKTLGYWGNAAAFAAARAGGCDEVLLENFCGEITGASMANLFYADRGGWLTPPESSGARAGVVRGVVLDLIGAEERTLSTEAVAEIESAFLTSSGLGVMPVRAVGGRELPGFARAVEIWRAFEDSGLQ